MHFLIQQAIKFISKEKKREKSIKSTRMSFNEMEKSTSQMHLSRSGDTAHAEASPIKIESHLTTINS